MKITKVEFLKAVPIMNNGMNEACTFAAGVDKWTIDVVGDDVRLVRNVEPKAKFVVSGVPYILHIESFEDAPVANNASGAAGQAKGGKR